MGSVLHEAVVLRGIFPCCQVLVEKAASALRLRLFAYCWYVHNNRDGIQIYRLVPSQLVSLSKLSIEVTSRFRAVGLMVQIRHETYSFYHVAH